MKQLTRRLSKVADSSQYNYEPLRSDYSSKRQASTVPEGHVPVHVGEETETEVERFVIRAELLSRPIFLELLQRSAQEYGYEQQGVLRIPCRISLFKHVLQFLES